MDKMFKIPLLVMAWSIAIIFVVFAILFILGMVMPKWFVGV